MRFLTHNFLLYFSLCIQVLFYFQHVGNTSVFALFFCKIFVNFLFRRTFRHARTTHSDRKKFLYSARCRLPAMTVKACAFCLCTAACIASGNAYLLCLALAAFVKTAVLGMAAHACFRGSVLHGIGHALAPLAETLTTCLIRLSGVLPSYHDVALRAKLVVIVRTICYSTS